MVDHIDFYELKYKAKKLLLAAQDESIPQDLEIRRVQIKAKLQSILVSSHTKKPIPNAKIKITTSSPRMNIPTDYGNQVNDDEKYEHLIK